MSPWQTVVKSENITGQDCKEMCCSQPQVPWLSGMQDEMCSISLLPTQLEKDRTGCAANVKKALSG